MQKAFVALPDLTDPALFDLLYCSRDNEYNTLAHLLATDCKAGLNIVLTGDPGVGKTTFLTDALLHKHLAESLRLHLLWLNCRKYEARSANDQLHDITAALVSQFTAYFDAVGTPCNIARTGASLDARFVHVKDHLAQQITPAIQNRLYPIIVIDDVDYIEEHMQHVLLTVINDLIASCRVAILYTCREPALKEVTYHLSDRPRAEFTQLAKTLRLYPIDPAHLLARRLAVTIEVARSKPRVQRICEGLWQRRGVFDSYIQSFGWSVANAAAIPYPFTDNQEYYMGELSDGDARVLFQVADRLLGFTLDEANAGRWEQRADGTRYIGRANLLGLLTDWRERGYRNPTLPVNYDELYRAINVHQHKSYGPKHHKNSLLQNILELLVNERDIHPASQLWRMLRKLGHDDHEILTGLEFCRQARLIAPVVIAVCGPPRQRMSKELTPYTLTRKGELYVKELMHWKEYRALFGAGDQSAYELDGGLACSRLYEDALELLCALVGRYRGESQYLKVDKAALWDLFVRKYGRGYATRETGGGPERMTITLRTLERELVRVDNRGVVSSYKVEERTFYAIKKGQVVRRAEERGLCHDGGTFVFPSHKFTDEEVDTFLQVHGAGSDEE